MAHYDTHRCFTSSSRACLGGGRQGSHHRESWGSESLELFSCGDARVALITTDSTGGQVAPGNHEAIPARQAQKSMHVERHLSRYRTDSERLTPGSDLWNISLDLQRMGSWTREAKKRRVQGASSSSKQTLGFSTCASCSVGYSAHSLPALACNTCGCQSSSRFSSLSKADGERCEVSSQGFILL